MSHTKYYTGIGSRETPQRYLEAMIKIAGVLGGMGYTLRSGAADGADSAFETGTDAFSFSKEIWLPWNGFNNHQGGGYLPQEIHYQLASELHPAWDRLTRGPRSLHARNTGQILGHDLATPSLFVVCYTSDGAESLKEVNSKTGGTGTAIRLASIKGIPVFNLARKDSVSRLKTFLITLQGNQL